MADFDFQALQRDMRRRMEGALEVLHKEFAGLRSGRATTSLLEPVMVDAYGSQMPLNQVGTVGAPEPRLLTVQVWDRGLAKSVEKAILESGLGLNPQTEGQTIRIPIPPLTEQRRQEFAKVASRYSEEARVAIRNVRRHALDELKRAEKEHAVSKDDLRGFSDQVQKMTDAFIGKIDDALAHKEAEIMQV